MERREVGRVVVVVVGVIEMECNLSVPAEIERREEEREEEEIEKEM